MKYLLVAVMALVLGGLAARALWFKEEEPVDPIQIIITQLKTHAIVEHERQIAIWYRTCPDVIGKDPQIFVAWPAKLSYELELGNIQITREGSHIKVRTSLIHADEPSVPTDFIDYLSTTSLFTFANESDLVNDEIVKASAIARYLSAYFLKWDTGLRGEFEHELQTLVERMASALGVPSPTVEVEIPEPKQKFPKLPKLELCGTSTASVNGLPFAKLQDGLTVPIGFRPQQATAVPKGIASVYGAMK